MQKEGRPFLSLQASAYAESFSKLWMSLVAQ